MIAFRADIRIIFFFISFWKFQTTFNHFAKGKCGRDVDFCHEATEKSRLLIFHALFNDERNDRMVGFFENFLKRVRVLSFSISSEI